ncbi:GNAT family N-acetyltransferase [Stenotrophomonas geniculata]|uniref:GNAT family N-acetyltransferase n=1 Tax=Stenotrophomonas geniculata TaxID=86188 RepID=UPI0039C67D13
MQVTLETITPDNYEAVCDLDVNEAQQDFVAGNTWSLVQAAFNPGYQTRAIRADGEWVGFFMWVPETPQRMSIWRFMVDQRWQGRGIGRRALELALAQIRATPGLAEIEIATTRAIRWPAPSTAASGSSRPEWTTTERTCWPCCLQWSRNNLNGRGWLNDFICNCHADRV